jgi:hypothetical protein
MKPTLSMKDALSVLSNTPVPKTSIGETNAEIWRLQGLLGMKETPPIFTGTRANARLIQLAAECKAKGIDASATPPATVQAPAPPAAVQTGPVSLDQQIVALGKSADGKPKASPIAIAQLESEISKMPAGLTRDCAEAKLKNLKS